MRKDYYEIQGPWPGRLAISPRPRGDDWLEDEIRTWKKDGFDLVVSLLTRDEERELGIEKEGTLARQIGLEFKSLPIPDRGVPRSRAAIQTLVGSIREHLKSDRNVLVHCRQGIGRSALVAASVLADFGADPKSVWSVIETARGVPVPDTPEQKRWVGGIR
jgi:protein tyrosine phosphatase (PTP) superfamily phosphohydrolase (DUF442 family)